MNKRGFIDGDIVQSPGFIILSLMALSATTAGYIWGKQMGYDAFPLWQILAIMAAELVAAYVFVARGS